MYRMGIGNLCMVANWHKTFSFQNPLIWKSFHSYGRFSISYMHGAQTFQLVTTICTTLLYQSVMCSKYVRNLQLWKYNVWFWQMNSSKILVADHVTKKNKPNMFELLRDAGTAPSKTEHVVTLGLIRGMSIVSLENLFKDRTIFALFKNKDQNGIKHSPSNILQKLIQIKFQESFKLA